MGDRKCLVFLPLSASPPLFFNYEYRTVIACAICSASANTNCKRLPINPGSCSAARSNVSALTAKITRSPTVRTGTTPNSRAILPLRWPKACVSMPITVSYTHLTLPTNREV